jgi:hypothetical protein
MTWSGRVGRVRAAQDALGRADQPAGPVSHLLKPLHNLIGPVLRPERPRRTGRSRGTGRPVVSLVAPGLVVGELIDQVLGFVGGFLRLICGLLGQVGGFLESFGLLTGLLGQMAGLLGQPASLVGLLLGEEFGIAVTLVNGRAGMGRVVGGVVLVLHHVPGDAVWFAGLSHALAGGDLPGFVRSHDRFFPGETARVCSPW